MSEEFIREVDEDLKEEKSWVPSKSFAPFLSALILSFFFMCQALLFSNDKFSLSNLKKYLINSEFSYINDLLKTSDLKKNLFSSRNLSIKPRWNLSLVN